MAIKINGKDLQKRIINGKEVEKVMLNGVQIWPEATPPVVDDYLCFTAEESNSTISLNGHGRYITPVSLEISTNNSSWNDYTIGDTITLSNIGDKVYFRNKSETQTGFSTRYDDYYYFNMTGTISGSGDIGFLLCKNSTTTMSNMCFYLLFENCTSLITSPDLPATTLADACYDAMFYGCTGLTVAPSLLATNLPEFCYASMFSGCTSLVTAPTISATTVGAYSCASMFSGCTSLTTAPYLPATTLGGSYCYSYMFHGCTSLVNVPTLPATTFSNEQHTLISRCYGNMFEGCTSLVNVPIMSFTRAATGLCSSMFAGCTSLETLPDLHKPLNRYCFENMFSGCSKIKISETQTGEYQIPFTVGTNFNETGALDNMFSNTGGTFTGTPNINTTYYTSNQVIMYAPGIYHNATLGLISLSSDGGDWITIADKNLGATGLIIYDSFGLYYQWGNNHGWPFPMDWDYPVGPGLQDVNGYGPGNYYSDTHFRSLGDGGWYVTPNSDLWGGVTNTDASKQGPCPSGYHIPTIQELDNIIAVGELMGVWDRVSNVPPIVTYLKLSGDAGHTPRNDGITHMGGVWIWGCTDGTGQTASSLFIDGGTLVLGYTSKADCNTIRPFKNTPVVPDSTRTVLYQPI